MKTLFIIFLAVLVSATINAVRAKDIPRNVPVEFRLPLDPKSSGCENPKLNESETAIYKTESGGFVAYIRFECGGVL